MLKIKGKYWSASSLRLKDDRKHLPDFSQVAVNFFNVKIPYDQVFE
jgi:hypothetical protein